MPTGFIGSVVTAPAADHAGTPAQPLDEPRRRTRSASHRCRSACPRGTPSPAARARRRNPGPPAEAATRLRRCSPAATSRTTESATSPTMSPRRTRPPVASAREPLARAGQRHVAVESDGAERGQHAAQQRHRDQQREREAQGTSVQRRGPPRRAAVRDRAPGPAGPPTRRAHAGGGADRAPRPRTRSPAGGGAGRARRPAPRGWRAPDRGRGRARGTGGRHWRRRAAAPARRWREAERARHARPRRRRRSRASRLTVQPGVGLGMLGGRAGPRPSRARRVASDEVAPGARRAITFHRRSARLRSSDGVERQRIPQRDAEPSSGKRKPAGMTPTTSCGMPSRVMRAADHAGIARPSVRPRRRGSAPPPGRGPDTSSSGRKPRPSAGTLRRACGRGWPTRAPTSAPPARLRR